MSFRFRKLTHAGRTGPEALEDRTLLAGHGFGGFWHHGPGSMALVADVAGQAGGFFGSSQMMAARDSVFAGWGGHHYQEQRNVLTASLSDSETGATATVTYKAYVEDGVSETELKVSVSGAEADSSLDVTIGDTVVGQVATDAEGNGTLVLSSDPDEGEQPLPADFPTDVSAGMAVGVGTLTGTLEAPTRPGEGCHGTQGTALRASLDDPTTGATATVKYRTRTVDDETRTRLVVRVTGAEADSTLDVTIGDTVVGQITTDSDGGGSLVLSSDLKEGEQPLPADFPATIAPGTTISVGTLSGTLETAHFGGRRFGWRH